MRVARGRGVAAQLHSRPVRSFLLLVLGKLAPALAAAALAVQEDAPRAVEDYRAHENHRRYMDVFLRPMLAMIKVWNFELR